jgi:hypothetical protein
MNLTPSEHQLLTREMGLEVLKRLTTETVPEHQSQRFHWPKCTQCRRRPTMTIRSGTWLKMRTGLKPSDGISVSVPKHQALRNEVVNPEFVLIPRYDILPCCSARYIKENDADPARAKRDRPE